MKRMITRSNKIIFILVGLLLFSACSIEKRHYTSGYHMEWKHSIKTNNSVDEHKEIIGSSESVKQINSEKISNKTLQLTDSNIQINQGNTLDLIPVIEQQINNTTKINETISTNSIEETLPEIANERGFVEPILKPTEDPVIVDPLAIFSMIFDLAGLLIALLTSAPIFIGFALPFIGFIFGIISLCRIAMNPNKYKGLGWALLGMFASLIILTVVLLVFLI